MIDPMVTAWEYDATGAGAWSVRPSIRAIHFSFSWGGLASSSAGLFDRLLAHACCQTAHKESLTEDIEHHERKDRQECRRHQQRLVRHVAALVQREASHEGP